MVLQILSKIFGRASYLHRPAGATQMNAGAAAATGDILLFLHGDTLLPRGYDDSARRALANPSAVAGAFELKIDARRLTLRLVETAVNWRSNFLQLPYGDQAIFLKAVTFDKIGGFADLPLMEDFEFVRRLKKTRPHRNSTPARADLRPSLAAAWGHQNHRHQSNINHRLFPGSVARSTRFLV